ncbi:peptidyl-prolyl cis-trans isomerase, FKBP-type [Monoraphidium neglectum]|uniref:peptidylprolyl isomerase n=1 Tax=Monoraphidium neglectum TaxID=145388 RepID=A0A0D2NPJ5_9CHLO|nr:peptidyl-prolyl cis-trans isomerase, FKBP-type [Monoraphidium neglectum]KIZ06351.1 peptidyl-prolyl cis-trans isomerase, FKBP-type [Monoraphidium neglectum]|eukprot:XP_013905370.1 peptidyl-prolyl cis-trans isomerase, FKBP-type [Monoraphidium neglectum]
MESHSAKSLCCTQSMRLLSRSGYTKGYQGKRIGNTTVKDVPYEFVVGSGQAIAAFEEAVSTMKVGGIRRVEIPGARPELGYSLNRAERFTDELISPDLKIFK